MNLNQHNKIRDSRFTDRAHGENLSAAPLVSVITPFLNAEKFLAEAIRSVLAQRDIRIELLLVDDGSADRSPEIARQFAAQQPSRIRLLSHAGRSHRGLSAARNLGLQQARGKYLTFLDADDVLLPQALARQAAVLDSHAEADVVCGALECWYSWTGDARDARRDFLIRPVVPAGQLYHPPQMLRHTLRAWGRKPGMGSFMFRRALIEQTGAFETDFTGQCEDQVFWARLGLRSSVFVTDHCLVRYRQHPDSMCAVAMREGRDLMTNQTYLRWLARFLNEAGIRDAEIQAALSDFQRGVEWQTRCAWLKQLYRRLLPLSVRYQIRQTLLRLCAGLQFPAPKQTGQHAGDDRHEVTGICLNGRVHRSG